MRFSIRAINCSIFNNELSTIDIALRSELREKVRGCRRDTLSQSRSTVNYSTASRWRRRRWTDLGGDFSSPSTKSPRPFAGRLRGYRNHLTTSSRLGAFAPSRLSSPRLAPRAARSLSRDNCPFLNRARLSAHTIAGSLTLAVTRCVVFVHQPRTVNVVKIRSPIDNLIVNPSDSERVYPFSKKIGGYFTL